MGPAPGQGTRSHLLPAVLVAEKPADHLGKPFGPELGLRQQMCCAGLRQDPGVVSLVIGRGV